MQFPCYCQVFVISLPCFCSSTSTSTGLASGGLGGCRPPPNSNTLTARPQLFELAGCAVRPRPYWPLRHVIGSKDAPLKVMFLWGTNTHAFYHRICPITRTQTGDHFGRGGVAFTPPLDGCRCALLHLSYMWSFIVQEKAWHAPIFVLTGTACHVHLCLTGVACHLSVCVLQAQLATPVCVLEAQPASGSVSGSASGIINNRVRYWYRWL